jgi:hypothetical protein
LGPSPRLGVPDAWIDRVSSATAGRARRTGCIGSRKGSPSLYSCHKNMRVSFLLLASSSCKDLPVGLGQFAGRWTEKWRYRRRSRASSSRSKGSGQERPAAVARLIVASTVLLPTPQVLAVSRLLWLQDQTRRSISRVFRMVTLSLGIKFSLLVKQRRTRYRFKVTPRLFSHCTLAFFRNGGRNRIGMLAFFPLRNGGLFPAGMLAVFEIRNTHL